MFNYSLWNRMKNVQYNYEYVFGCKKPPKQYVHWELNDPG